MLLDLALLALLLIAFVSGFRQGFVVQIVRLGVLVGAYLGARVVYADLAPLAGSISPEMPEPFRNLLAFAVVFAVLQIVGSLLVGLAVKRFHDTHPVAGGVDRLLGGLLGLVKSAGILYLLLCFGLALAPVLGAADVHAAVQKSQVARFVAEHNLLHGEADVYLKGLKGLAAVVKDPEKRARLAADKDVQAYFEDEGRALAEDPKLAAALEAGDWATLLKDERVLKALQDPRFYRALARVEAGEVAPEPAPGATPPVTPAATPAR